MLYILYQRVATNRDIEIVNILCEEMETGLPKCVQYNSLFPNLVSEFEISNHWGSIYFYTIFY
jgi:hypothetical protein